MIKKIAFIFFVCIVHFQIFGQDSSSASVYYSEGAEYSETMNANFDQTSRSYYERHWTFGGSLGFNFWDDQTSIVIAPKAYYNVSPKFLTGFGVTYMYSDNDSGIYSYSANSFGGSVMGAIRPIPNLQLDIEYEGIQTSRNSGLIEDDFWNNALYLGASFIAGKVSFGFRYDVLFDQQTSVYASAFNPVIGFYF